MDLEGEKHEEGPQTALGHDEKSNSIQTPPANDSVRAGSKDNNNSRAELLDDVRELVKPKFDGPHTTTGFDMQ